MKNGQSSLWRQNGFHCNSNMCLLIALLFVGCVSDGWPMSQRNFPPSFWNSAYQPPSASLPSATLATDPYLSGSFHGFTGFHPQDAWHYPSTSQSRPHGFSHHRSMAAMPGVHDFSYASMASPSHYSPHYGSILMQQSLRPGRLAHGLSHQYDLGMLGKSPESWGSRLNATGRLGADFTSTSSLDPSASGKLHPSMLSKLLPVPCTST